MIPRTVHRIWLGGPEPEWTQSFAETWRQPGWDLRHWDDEAIGELFPLANQVIFDEAPQLAPDHVGQLRSDVLRYEILHRFGGVYVDTDFECLRPIDPLLEEIAAFAAWEQPRRWINNAILGSTPGHPFLAALIDELPANVEANAGYKPNRLSGPRHVTQVWLRHGKGVKIFDRDLFYPFGWAEVADYMPGTFDPAETFPKAYCCHYWNNARRRRNLFPG